MAKEAIPQNLGLGGAHLNRDVLRSILQELQGLKFNTAAGALKDVDITVAGIKVEDTILSVMEIDVAGDAMADRTSEAIITDDNDVQLDTTDTTGSHLLIIWLDKKP